MDSLTTALTNTRNAMAGVLTKIASLELQGKSKLAFNSLIERYIYQKLNDIFKILTIFYNIKYETRNIDYNVHFKKIIML